MKFIIKSGKRHMADEPMPCGGAFKGVSVDSRGRKEDVWFIECPTVDDLTALQQRLGYELILGRQGDTPRLVIYDDYLE